MNAPEKKPQPRWARRKDARPEEIIAAALDLFVERGFASTRLDDVAARAGVSKGTLYLYFANKEDLFKAVVRGNILPVLQYGEDLVTQYSGSSADLVRKLVRDCLSKQDIDPRFFTTTDATKDLESLRVAIGACAGQHQPQPVVSQMLIVAQQSWRAFDRGQDDIEIAVAVDVGERRSTRDHGPEEIVGRMSRD